MLKTILAVIVGILLASPSAAFAGSKHATRSHKRAHVAKKAKPSKQTKLANAAAPAAAVPQRKQPVVSHAASSASTQAVDSETPGKRK